MLLGQGSKFGWFLIAGLIQAVGQRCDLAGGVWQKGGIVELASKPLGNRIAQRLGDPAVCSIRQPIYDKPI
jgi:hypothetical protein